MSPDGEQPDVDSAGRSIGSAPLQDLLEPPTPDRRRMRLPDVVADELTDEILSRGLAPGDPLPTEANMLKQFDVSRATLREALRILETRGVLSMRTGRGRGPVVARPSLAALVESLKLNLRFLNVSFDEVLATREAIEPQLAAAAATNRGYEDLVALRSIHTEMLATPWDSGEMRVLNREFHTAIAAASHTRPLAMLWSAISTVADGQDVGGIFNDELWETRLAAYAAVIAAIEKRDSDNAARRMRAQVEDLRRMMQASDPEHLTRPAFPQPKALPRRPI